MHKKNILLISANFHTSPYPVYPLALSYIATYLRKKLQDYTIQIFDVNLNNLESLEKTITDFDPRYIGVSLRNVDDIDSTRRTNFLYGYIPVFQKIRQVTKAKIIVGGGGFSIFPELLFKTLNPDIGVIGEGEDIFYQIIHSLDNNIGLDKIQGIIYNDKQKIKVNKRKTYLYGSEIHLEDELIPFYWDKSGMLNIQTKRGCPYKCIYCTYPIIEGTKVRNLDADSIVETLKELYFSHKIRYIFFTDSVFNINNDFNIILAEKIIQSGVNISWGAYFSPHNLNQPLLEILQRAGLKHIEFGTESLSDTQLRNYGKHFTVDEVITSSELCNKVGIYIAHFLILGGYGETQDTLNETFENSLKINHAVFFPYIGMRIYPGTTLYQIALKEKKISIHDNLLDPVYYIADNISLEDLKSKASTTRKNWVFPDDDKTEIVDWFRKKNKKGLLWHLITS